jgi:C-terminal processing protease CtpA/Prc
MKKTLLFTGVLLMLFTACKKNKPSDTPGPSNNSNDSIPATGSTLDKIRDSIFLYAKQAYYWYDQLPTYSAFNPRSITGSTDLDALQAEVNKLSQYAINPDTKMPYEYYANAPDEAKYSFIDEGETSTRLSAVTGDFGFGILYRNPDHDDDLRVKYVYPNSPADAAGLKRGYRILSINGRTNLTYNPNDPTNLNFVVNAFSNSSTITMTLQKPDNTTFSATLNTSSYKVNPILATSVIDTAGKKVGYIVFNSFVSLASAQAGLASAFSTFATAGITDLVVDLRYDGGGYVETAEYIDNLIAPSSASGSQMYTAYFNSILTSQQATILKNQTRLDQNNQPYTLFDVDYSVAGNRVPFTKQGSLNNLAHVIFLVTSSTASASELTINNLRPYMNVQLIGTTTYGKPVGFFDIDINKYEMYIPEFETKNAAGQGGYYLGMKPGSSDYPGLLTQDDPIKDFGDHQESLLSKALSYVANNYSYSQVTTTALQTEAISTSSANNVLADPIAAKLSTKIFNGMVQQRHRLKK